MFSNDGKISENFSFSPADLAKILSSSDGRRLLALLQRNGGDTLKKAVDAAKAGSYSEAKNLLEPMLTNPEAAELLGRLKNG